MKLCLILLVASFVAVALAAPPKATKPAPEKPELKVKARTGKVLSDHDIPLAITNKDKTNKKTLPQQKGPGPYLYFREPRAFGYVAQSDIEIDGAGPVVKRPSSWVGPRYRINNKQFREEEDDTDSEEGDDDQEDDVQDDVDFNDDSEESFDTPSWDYLFPKEQTGQYARRNPGGKPPRPAIYAEQEPSTSSDRESSSSSGGYALAPGSPGGAPVDYRGRSGPWSKVNKQPWSGKQVRYVPVRVSKSRPSNPWWEEQEVQGQVVPQWVGQGQREREPVYYQSQYVPSPVRRRNWNNPIVWGPQVQPNNRRVWQGPRRRPVPVSAESEEEDDDNVRVVAAGPQQVPWGAQPQGPRRIKSWQQQQQPSWVRGQRQQKWGYY